MAEMVEIRWHGRGGQGTVTAAKVLADACLSGEKNVQAFPEYGPERAGAPIKAYNRISAKELRMHCPVANPNIVAVVDVTLLDSIDVTEGATKTATYIINTTKEPGEIRAKLGVGKTAKVFTVNASGIATECFGRPLPNSTMLGAISKATGIVPLKTVMDDVRASFGSKFAQKIIDGNVEATKRGYEEVKEG